MVHNPEGETDETAPFDVHGTIKWFDPVKGFGFILSDAGGADILIHMNVLRNFGQSSIADGAQVSVSAIRSARGLQAVALFSITPPDSIDSSVLSDLADMTAFDISGAPLEPARVKWFDKTKGFGFANIFGHPEDVFLHVEILRQSGLSDLQPGEALALKVMDGKRGKMAAKVQAWETVGLDQRKP